MLDFPSRPSPLSKWRSQLFVLAILKSHSFICVKVFVLSLKTEWYPNAQVLTKTIVCYIELTNIHKRKAYIYQFISFPCVIADEQVHLLHSEYDRTVSQGDYIYIYTILICTSIKFNFLQFSNYVDLQFSDSTIWKFLKNSTIGS